MMIPCNYEINVAKKTEYPKGHERYIHYCKIELGDGLEEKAIEKFNEIRGYFPKNEFECTLREITCYGKEVMRE